MKMLKSVVKKFAKKSKLSKASSLQTLDTRFSLQPEADSLHNARFPQEEDFGDECDGSDSKVATSVSIQVVGVPAPSCERAAFSEDDVRALFYLWNDALATLDPDQVVARYSSKPCHLPIMSDVPITDYHSITDYFVHFLEKKPQATILESHVNIGSDWCTDNGICEFYMEATGDVVKAQYSFIYIKEGDEWKISHHHSSQLPEEVLIAKAVPGLFGDLLDELNFTA